MRHFSLKNGNEPANVRRETIDQSSYWNREAFHAPIIVNPTVCPFPDDLENRVLARYDSLVMLVTVTNFD